MGYNRRRACRLVPAADGGKKGGAKRMAGIRESLLEKLTGDQEAAITSDKRRLLVVAGAGSGKTEVMARRVAWWVGINKTPKDDIVAFTFTDRAAEEMKFRIRKWIGKVTPAGEEVALGGMYVGTIHGFCIRKLREFWPDDYHNFEILDEGSRTALILRGYEYLLGLKSLQAAILARAKAESKNPEKVWVGKHDTVDAFTAAYDQLHEHNLFDIRLGRGEAPYELGEKEEEWCKEARLLKDVGARPEDLAFAQSAARYYAYLRCRRFLDFSTSQSEFTRRLQADSDRLNWIADRQLHLVVDEVQDINPIQRQLIDLLVGKSGVLTAVGDHRQSIYAFRGAKVEIMGKLWEELKASNDGQVVDLRENFRSTPRIINLANRWSETIGRVRSMSTAAMKHGQPTRQDHHKSHAALVSFNDRSDEASWIAEAIRVLVPSEAEGARHDKRDGTNRGLQFSDVAVLVRSSTDVRTYMEALNAAGVPSVVRAGPDLFSQPEILLFVSALAITADIDTFYGSQRTYKGLPARIKSVLDCEPEPRIVLHAAARAVRASGLAFHRNAEDRLMFVAEAIRDRIAGKASLGSAQASIIQSRELREFLTGKEGLRRVFPQKIFHWLLSESDVQQWDTCSGRGEGALFHLAALSGLVKGIETPGWTSAKDYHWQMIGMCHFGAAEGRTEEQPLLVPPNAVSVTTIHGAKGLEFPAVFVADVCARRFPSINARKARKLPLSGKVCEDIDLESLRDNENHDGERRLMYVAVTRAERFLFLSHCGKDKSKFITELGPLVAVCGGTVTTDPNQLLSELRYAPKEHDEDIKLATSFSDLRYYLECPHDFYLRKVLGFAPTIDQVFGYGTGVHNLLRAVHSDPKRWADFAKKGYKALREELEKLVGKGLFYLRYTTGAPAERMRESGVNVTARYVEHYADKELSRLVFEPEKEFETLVEFGDGTGGALISGAIDIVRQDDPPKVTLIDFKTGNPEVGSAQQLTEELMQLQVALYALAAKKELEYQPERGLVRYLGSEVPPGTALEVPLDEQSLKKAKAMVASTAKKITNREFKGGPAIAARDAREKARCGGCDFGGFCGMESAKKYRERKPGL